jgi:hypothetical protein
MRISPALFRLSIVLVLTGMAVGSLRLSAQALPVSVPPMHAESMAMDMDCCPQGVPDLPICMQECPAATLCLGNSAIPAAPTEAKARSFSARSGSLPIADTLRAGLGHEPPPRPPKA